MSEIVLKIDGMTCMHCKMRVESALREVPGVTGVQVTWPGNRRLSPGRRRRL